MQKVTTFLMYNSGAAEAMEFYTSIFKNSRIVSKIEMGGKVMGGTFELEGQQYHCYEAGGDYFKFTEGISIMVSCPTQEEIDYYWERLKADGGAESQCGWLTDKFGVSWQVCPPQLMEALTNPDKEKADRAFQAMLSMKKIILADIEAALKG
ncbi:MAG TPA: VOC family protein [Candidatus Kapabacteria bacterium]|nr:VOC family protein [Candidatus Kapabacteria bacterium]